MQDSLERPFPPDLGFTYCLDVNDKPVGVSYVLIGPLDSLGLAEMPATVAHEMKHVEQISRFESCNEYHKYLSANRAEVEAEAFCAEVRYAVANRGMKRDDALYMYSRWLQESYPNIKVSREVSQRLMEQFC